MNPKQCPSQKELSGYANGTLPAAAADEVTEHISACATCEDTLQNLGQSADGLLRQIQAKPTVERYVDESACRQAVGNVVGNRPAAERRSSGSPAPASPTAGTPAPERAKTMNRNEFVEFLTTSGLITAADLTATIKSRPAAETGDAPTLAKALVQLEKLTKYQAAAIYQGKGKSLFYGDYLVLDRIGAGGMGQVFKARHRRMDRIVALKVMSPAAIKNADSVRRFEREVRAAAKLVHPNVVHAYDAGVQDDVRYLVMEYVEGCDLSAVIKQHPKLGIKQTCGFIEQAARGFAAAHAKGIVHRDVKPGNLLIDKSGVVKVLDMGLARFDDEGIGGAMTEGELTQSGSVMGTVDYMAPEQALDTRHADAKSDVYGLGCTLYRALAGEPVYGGRTLVEKILAHRDHPVPSLRKLRPDAPLQLDALLQRMMAKNPADRPTMSEVGDALSTLDPTAKPGPVEVPIVPTTSGGLPSPTGNPSAVALPTGGFGVAPSFNPPQVAAAPQAPRTAGTAPPRKNRTLPILAAAGAGGVLILAGIWVYIKNKEGQNVAAIELPEGGSVQITTETPRGTGATIAKPTGTSLAVATPTGIPATPVAPTPVAAKPIAPIVPPVAATPIGGATPTGSPIAPNGIAINTPSLPVAPMVDPAAERAAALALLSSRAKLKFDASGVKSDWISSPTQLPTAAFRVTEVSFYQIKDATDETIAPLRYLTSLETLDLHQTIVTDEGLSVLKDLKKLSSVNISSTQVHGSGIRYLVGLPELKYLAVSDKSVDPSTSQWLAQLKALEKFDAVRTQLSDLSWVVETPRLKEINVGGARVSNISALAALPNLQSLNIWRSFIVDADLAAFRNSKELEVINFVEADITDAGLSHFEGLPKLKRIDAVDTYVTADGAAKLREKIPNLDIRIRTKPGSPPSQRRSPPPLPVEAVAVVTKPAMRKPPSLPVAAPPTEVTPAQERDAALSLLSRQAMLRVAADGKDSDRITSAAQLPAGPFKIIECSFLPDARATDQDLIPLRYARDLRQVELHTDGISDEGLVVLAGMPKLWSVALVKTSVRGPGLRHLVTCSGLQRLIFTEHIVDNSAVEPLTELQKVGQIVSLRGPLSDLSFAGRMPTLGALNLDGCDVTDLRPLSTAKQLIALTIPRTYVVDSDLATLQGFPRLADLDLSATDITDTGVALLADLPKLGRINLTDTFVTEAGAAKLRAKFPGVNVILKTRAGSPPSPRRRPQPRTLGVASTTPIPRGVPVALPSMPAFAPRPSIAKERKAPPAAADQTGALKLIQDTFKDEIAAAKTPEQKTGLAARYIDQARQTLDDAAARYVLLTEARELAIEGGALEVLNDALNPLIEEFTVDETAMRLDGWNAILKRPRVDATTTQQLAKMANSLFDQATTDADFEVGKRYGDFALSVTRRLPNSTGAVKLVAERNAALAARQKEWPTVTAAVEKLKTSPDDAEANLTLARYRGLSADDWPAAFPLYAKSGDETLKVPAEKSIAALAGSILPAVAGDIWWDAAQPHKAPQKNEYLAAADFWYRRAASQLSGLSKTRVEKRIAEIETLIPTRKIVASNLPGSDGGTSKTDVSGDERAFPNRSFGEPAKK